MSGWAVLAAAIGPTPPPELPGQRFEPPARATAPGAPLVFEHNGEAGPDQTFFLVGANLAPQMFGWGASADKPAGQEWPVRVHFCTNGWLAGTLPDRAPDGPFLVWLKNQSGWSAPLVLNTPQPWWCGPDATAPGGIVRVFGRNLSRRPDFNRAFIYLCQPGKAGVWAETVTPGKYAVSFRMPDPFPAGDYQVWVHGGAGGEWGWGGPVKLKIASAPTGPASGLSPSSSRGGPLELKPNVSGGQIQAALEALAERGGGAVKLPAGHFKLTQTLRLPPAVMLVGAGKNATTLELARGEPVALTRLEGSGQAVVWLSGDGAGLSDLTILGNPQANVGIALRSPKPTLWLSRCVVERVRVADCEGKQAENMGLHARYVSHARVADNELWGRAPLFISGARQSEFSRNRLVSATRFGGNAEAAILGRNETLEECIIEDNRVASPPGAGAGGPTARRLIWLSTGHGSITKNWLARNGVEEPRGPGAGAPAAAQARFGGVAGTDQNVGEMILFEANHRTAYFGPLAGADAQSVILPKILPPTPDDRLGSVKRNQLAHDAQGNETPFWPPDADDGGEEPPIHEYYVTVFAGPGQGQTRRVLQREGQRLVLDQPWAAPPAPGSVVAVGTAFYRNLIVDNYCADGMTGIQLWISCIENVVAGNTIARQRKPGLFLYANGTTLASSMPRQWNRGISPLFWNLAEGNLAEECSAGALVTSGDDAGLPIEFPRALGTVLRHNSFLRSRSDGVIISSRGPAAGVRDTSPSIVGAITEFNVVRDAQVAYHAAASCDALVFRRNHAYFWYPVSPSTNAPIAFLLGATNLTAAFEANSLEGLHGDHDGRIIDLKTPAGVKRLPQ